MSVSTLAVLGPGNHTGSSPQVEESMRTLKTFRFLKFQRDPGKLMSPCMEDLEQEPEFEELCAPQLGNCDGDERE